VIDSLVRLQVAASPQSGDQSIEAFRLRFDYEKLMWEVDFTIDHFYKNYLKRSLSDKVHSCIRDGFSEICEFLAEQPVVLTHRDFHSRNLMVFPMQPERDTHPFRMVMIDFQDARLGPPQYDLASLLKDSYYQLDESQIALLIDYYIARYEAVSGQEVDRAHFIRVFDLMSVQRNFKAIGSFASFMNRRGDPTYLKYIGNTFENIRRSLLKYPHFSQLREALYFNYYF
jgi:aminoglycoside/choline kinase family phosphotransferase